MRLKALVKEVMKTNVITIDADSSIKEAAFLMKDNGIGSVIVTGAKHVKGIATAEDIVYKHVADGVGKKISEIMSEKLITIDPEKTLEQASELMEKHSIKKLPVMKSDKLLGIITASDIARIEPILFETLIEGMKIGRKSLKPLSKTGPTEQCETCGNFTDDIHEVNGEWICSSCEEVEKNN
ncbi:MAG: CBS domain-containing protein [Candidatus Aenigmarchaeota archaeon]|nr:CBS domain-containing protein [Candidatus Aenigmarchaeota archaeon]